MEVVAADVVITVMVERPKILRCLQRISISRARTLGSTRLRLHQRKRMTTMRIAFLPTVTRRRTKRMRKTTWPITQRNHFSILYRLQRRLPHHPHEAPVDGEVEEAETVERKKESVTSPHLVSLEVWD
jgi:hypothetical protein